MTDKSCIREEGERERPHILSSKGNHFLKGSETGKNSCLRPGPLEFRDRKKQTETRLPRAGASQVRDEGKPMREQERRTVREQLEGGRNFKPFVAHLP